MEFTLPKNFLLGVSTAATQIEGGDTSSNWNDWYKKGRITDGTDPATANDHWLRWREDTALMAELGIKTYRFSLEWSRLEPEKGRYDEAAFAQYRDEILLMKEKGIIPLLTIHHFSVPMWYENKGGFSKEENIADFLALVRQVVEHFGDIVSDYVTINEPNVYATNSWCFGMWPPGHKSFKETVAVMENMACAHIKAYGIIHTLRRKMGYSDTKVGFANHVRVFEPENPKNPAHAFFAKAIDHLFQGALSRAMSLGEFPLPLKNRWGLPRGEYSDFIGVNYYSRSTISGPADGVRKNCPKNDLGWEIYPEGIVRVSEMLHDILPRPIYVTENGTCDLNDSFRSRYIHEHLKAIARSDLPFERYYHWCFCDNFEWIEGNHAKFGIVSIEGAEKKRVVKKSGSFYAEIIRKKGVDRELYEKYVAAEEYNIR